MCSCEGFEAVEAHTHTHTHTQRERERERGGGGGFVGAPHGEEVGGGGWCGWVDGILSQVMCIMCTRTDNILVSAPCLEVLGAPMETNMQGITSRLFVRVYEASAKHQ